MNIEVDAEKLANDLSRRLTVARKLKRMSQADVAKEVGITQAAYSTYETGKVLPTLLTLYALSEVLEANIAWLLGLPEGEGKGPI